MALYVHYPTEMQTSLIKPLVDYLLSEQKLKLEKKCLPERLIYLHNMRNIVFEYLNFDPIKESLRWLLYILSLISEFIIPFLFNEIAKL